MKKTLVLLLGVAMLFGLFGCTNKDRKDNATQGTCGKDITWQYDKRTATLTITGTGPMEGE